jgi:glucose/arabinose dehydrogenase
MKHLLLLTLLLQSCLLLAQPQLSLTAVPASGLNAPLQVVNAGDGSARFFVVQKGGTIRVYGLSWDFLDNFLTVTNLGGSFEGGLLSLVFHPDYASNGFFYVYYTNTFGQLELARYRVSANNPDKADPDTKVVLLSIPHPNFNNHNGGELHFGADGYLYLSTGDGGNPLDPDNNGQHTDILLGKLLRLSVDTSAIAPYYSIPADNPFGNEVYATGFRNPFRWSFDPLTQDLWISDVGSSIREEINFLPAGAGPGANFGWSCMEGELMLNTGFCEPDTPYVLPVYTYITLPPVSVIGGVVYRGAEWPDLQGYYVSADHYSGNWFLIYPDATGGWANTIQTLPVKGIADFGLSENGEVYVVSITENMIYQLSTTTSSTANPFEDRASQVQLYPSLVISQGALYVGLQGIPFQWLQLCNPAGEILLTQDIQNAPDPLQLHLPALPSGVYWLKLSARDGTVVRRFVVK